ncbi:MAG: hypothetical protein L0215_14645 [Gemmataceae bacterium]|nr:hypothetical protein [Gemmataceae bacterium]
MPWRLVCNHSEPRTSTAKACEAPRYLALLHAFAVLIQGSHSLQGIGESMPPSIVSLHRIGESMPPSMSNDECHHATQP